MLFNVSPRNGKSSGGKARKVVEKVIEDGMIQLSLQFCFEDSYN
jgi:hypothetical protein